MTEDTDSEDSDWCDSNASSLVEAETSQQPCYTVPRPPCDACGTNHHNGLHNVSLGDEGYMVCGDCLTLLKGEIESHYWWERLTEAHYDRAAEFLRSLDEVWCVKDHAYAGGELWVHTPFCNAAVVNDVCTHFGFRIRWFSVVHPGNAEFECVYDHGPCIEINLDYNHRISGPLPLEYDIIDDVTYHDVEWHKAHQKMFHGSE